MMASGLIAEQQGGRTSRAAVCALVTLLLSAGCATELLSNRPHLGQLYDRSAQSHGFERNPVIVIPGLTGSKLIDEASGRVVWGAFSGDYARPKRAADARLIALPMEHGRPLNELHDQVRSAGVLDLLTVKVLGIPINLRAYYYILEALGVGGYRDESLASARGVEWGDDHFTCFQFDYDWRRDNVENAQRLHRFIEEKRAYVRRETLRRYGVDRSDLEFDVVGHSMGGLLLRYYLRYGAADLPADGSLPPVTWAGAANIGRAILVAPPNAGSLQSLLQLIEGKDYGPFAHYPPALLGTFPAGYQMLPRGRHEMVAVGGEPIEDLFDPELWRRMQWGLASPKAEQLISWLLPDEQNPELRRQIALDHQQKALLRARQFTAALDQPAATPEGLLLHLIAGDATPTPSRMEIDGEARRLSIVETAPGDGKVLRTSALMDERLGGSWAPYLRSPVDWQHVMFLPQGHLDLTKDPVFTDNVLFWLLESPPPP